MKIFISLITLFIYVIGSSQKPQTVYSIVKDRHELSWYEEQEKLWKQEIDKDNKNANAWYNYYAANRAMRNLFYGNEDKQKEYNEKCNQIVNDAYIAVPNSFEANHMKSWNSGNGEKAFQYLEKAYSINPNDSRTFVDFITYYKITQEKEKYSEFCKKHFVANELAAPVLNWGYNILSEVDRNAIIFSAGDNDTYPIWVIQEKVVKEYITQVDTVVETKIINDTFVQYVDKPVIVEKIKYVEAPSNKEATTHSAYANHKENTRMLEPAMKINLPDLKEPNTSSSAKSFKNDPTSILVGDFVLND